MATSSMQFDFSLNPAGGKPRDGDESMRMLLLCDLGGSRVLPLRQRKPLALDIDSFEGLFKRLAATLVIELDGLPIEMPLGSIDHFNPDHLYASLAPFEALRRLRAEFENPTQFRRAAAALGLTAAPQPVAAPAAPDAAAAVSDIEWLLSPKPSAPPEMEHWLRGLVAPHIVPNVTHEQRALLAAADAALGALMRRVLHHPRLQALEASWRGIERLMRGLELDASLQLFVLDVSHAEIEADIAADPADLAASALFQHLSQDDQHFGLLVLDQAFGPDADDVQQLATLGAIAARAGTPLLAAATPQAAADALQTPHWAALRASPVAAWIGLVWPRVLLRLPYGAATSSISSFDFEEMPTPREHAAYLWGNGALALAMLVGRAFAQDAWGIDLGRQLDLDELPGHIYTEDGETHQQPCAELLLSDSAGQAVLARGIMPLMSWRNRDAVRLLRWQSLADPPCPLRGLVA